MSGEIEKFDAAQAMKNVREKIKDTFVSLIPDEQWNDMVKKEVDEYFKPKDEGYNNRTQSSSFTRDVHQVLFEEVKVRVKEYLTANFTNTWNNKGVMVCDAKVEEFINNNAGKILADMIGTTIVNALQQAGYRL